LVAGQGNFIQPDTTYQPGYGIFFNSESLLGLDCSHGGGWHARTGDA
jgi:hypothetical protein